MLRVSTTAEQIIVRSLREMQQTAQGRALAQDLCDEPKCIEKVEPLLREATNRVWKITTRNDAFFLKHTPREDPLSAFEATLSFAKAAAQFELGPEVIGWSESQRAILMPFIEAQAPPPYERDPAPYHQAMMKLRKFHQAFEDRIGPAIASYADLPWNIISKNHSDYESGLSEELTDAIGRIETLFRHIAPWIASHATIIHGNFFQENVLYSVQQNKWQIFLIDFDSCSIGHPYFDVAKYTLGFPLEQVHALFSQYLGKKQITREEHLNFQICQAALVLQVALTAFRRAQRGAILSDVCLSVYEMRTILRSGNCPSFTSISFADDSASYYQLRGIYALHEVLSQTQRILGDVEREHGADE